MHPEKHEIPVMKFSVLHLRNKSSVQEKFSVLQIALSKRLTSRQLILLLFSIFHHKRLTARPVGRFIW